MKKIVCKIKPFNDFPLNGCFKHQLLTIMQGYKLDLRIYLANFYYIYKLNNKKLFSLPMLFKPYNQIYQKMGMKMIKRKKINEIINYIIKKIDSQKLIILSCDCYGLSYRKDLYHQYHVLHYVLIYGYDIKKQIFYGVDHNYINSYEYKIIKISFEDIQDSFNNYQNNLLHLDNIRAYEFQKQEYKQKYASSSLIKNLILNKNKIYKGIKILKKQFKIYQKIISEETLIKEKQQEICGSILQIRQSKEIEKYQLYYCYKNNNINKILETIIQEYTYIFAILTKYSFTLKYNFTSMEKCIKKFENILELEEKLINTIYEIS